MIVITGAAGFIGSCLIAKLNEIGHNNLVLVDDFTVEKKRKNWENKQYVDKIQRNDFFRWAEQNVDKIDIIFHLGARTDTTETDYAIFEELNLFYSQQIWSFATKKGIPLLYASSAATYGNGKYGYDDSIELIKKIEPLNPYGKSKNEFDKWILKQQFTPPFWAGFKFFNVYGPNEYHKGRMASVVFHAFNQLQTTDKMQLFCSHNSHYKDGEQMRDFIYVKDVVTVLIWFMKYLKNSGIYNLGTGFARPFNALALALFQALKKEPQIEYIPMPEDIRNKYQYYTKAEMKKIRQIGYKKQFYSLEKGVYNYVRFYLSNNIIW